MSEWKNSNSSGIDEFTKVCVDVDIQIEIPEGWNIDQSAINEACEAAMLIVMESAHEVE